VKRLQTTIALTLIVSSIILYAAIPVCQAGDQSELPSKKDFTKVESQPEMLKQINPEYPAEAKKKGIEGKVVISTLVDKTGRPAKVEITESSGHKMLDEAALKAAQKAQFKPATQAGGPVAVWVSYTVKFALDDCEGTEDKKP